MPYIDLSVARQELENRIDSLNDQAWAILRQDHTQALQLATEAKTLASSEPFTPVPYQKGYAYSLINLANVYSYTAQYDLAISFTWEAIHLLEKLGNYQWMPRSYACLSQVYFILGDYSEALNYSLKRLEWSEKNNSQLEIGQSLMGLGAVYGTLNDTHKALEYFTQSIPIFREQNQAYWLGLSLSNLSEAHLNLKEYDKAWEAAQESYQVSLLPDAPKRVQLFALNAIGEAAVGMGNIPAAIHYFENNLKLAQEFQQPQLTVDALYSLGNLYLREKQWDKAEQFLQQACTEASAISYLRIMYEANERLTEVYEALNRPELALHHFKEFHQIKEKAFSEQSDQKIKHLEVLYRTQSAQKEAALYASLYEQEQGRRRLAETMQKVGTALSISLNLGDVLNQILRQLRELLYFDRAAVLLRKGNWLEVMASHDFPGGDDSFKGYRLELVPDKPSSFWQVYSTKQPFKIDDMSNYPQWRHIENLPSPKSWLGVPLIYQNEVRGMLSIARQTVKPFSEQDVETAITFAAPAAVALENAQLYDQIKRFNEHLEYEVTNRTEALRDAYEQLEKLDRTKSDFISVTAHELRTPITVLKGYGQILEQDKEVMANQMRAELITGILSGAGRLHEIVNTMLIMVKIDSRQLKIYPKPLSLSKIIGKIAAELAPDVADRQQSLNIDESIAQLPPVEGEPEVLTLVFSNILVNAIKYTPDRGRIEVFGRAWHNDPPQDHFPPSGVEIVVRDTGIGIAPEAKELIFTKFYQTGEVALHSSGKTKFKGGGPGLGLALARGIIEAHRGQLWAESPGYDEEKCPGSEFHIVLPLYQR